MRGIAVLGLVLLAGAAASMAAADDWQAPARGSQLRADLLDALRPRVEWQLGAPVEFVVHEMRVKGDHAFATLTPQRPGGARIDMRRTPMVLREDLDPDLAEGGDHVEALWVKSGRQWVAVHHAVGATDVWYSWEPICAEFRDVIPEACGGQ